MKEPKTTATAAFATLQQVVDRISANGDLSDIRKRDLKSALVTFGKIVDAPLKEIPLDLPAIRKALEGVVPMQAKVSRKRWFNLRSDLAAAIAELGLLRMLKTADLKLSKEWEELCRGSRAGQVLKACARPISTMRRWGISLQNSKPKRWSAISVSSGVTSQDFGTAWWQSFPG